MVWTHFNDMHSGGSLKQKPYENIYIEAPKREAIAIFYNRFGHDPKWIACDCCGRNYAVDEYDTLEEASQYEREYGWGGKRKLTQSKTMNTREYATLGHVLIIPEGEINGDNSPA
jgi:hypothetical protein